MLLLNRPAPNFTLPIEEDKEISLQEFRGKNIVLYFYPKDNTPGCIREAQDFRDAYEQFKELNNLIIGISPDHISSHRDFKNKYALPFALAADITTEVAQKYGVWKEKKLFNNNYMGVERSTFLIDRNGILVKIWTKVRVTGHAQEVLNTIKEFVQ